MVPQEDPPVQNDKGGALRKALVLSTVVHVLNAPKNGSGAHLMALHVHPDQAWG